jgi:RNAse (barnase) inhibitor barstar
MTKSGITSVQVPHTLVAIDCAKINDKGTFHDTFAKALGFPVYYARNMSAWIDCITYADDPDAGMTSRHAPKNGSLVLRLDNVREVAKRCPELHAALTDAAAFVNWRRMEQGEAPVLALSYHE